MPDKLTELLLVVPIYSEERLLKNSMNTLYDFMKQSGIDFKIVLSVDQSQDTSDVIARDFSKDKEDVLLITHPYKMGRGYAVREAWSLFRANFYAFIDADLSTGVKVISHAYDLAKDDNIQVITASRYVKGARVRRPPLRMIVSKVYNSMLRLIFKDNILDHQCGFKLVSDFVCNDLLSLTSTDSWFWDTEMLVVGSKRNYKMIEVPVQWKEIKYRKTPYKRLISDIYLHGVGILKLLDEVDNIKASHQHLATTQKEESERAPLNENFIQMK